MTSDYKAAYERQKKAREKAEEALEQKSRELFDSHQSLMTAYTKLKNQKAQLLHQEKLASIGQLSAGIAHEINNPVGYVKSNISSFSEYVNNFKECIELFESFVNKKDFSDSRVAEVAQVIKSMDLEYQFEDIDSLIVESTDGVDRVISIVNSLKNFARVDSVEKQDIDINECIRDTLHLVSSSLKYKADVDLKLGDVCAVSGRKGELSQVILNLVSNAADAIEGHGNITISTYMRETIVGVSIADDGVGISAVDLSRIFDPFFSTKEVGEGTGLGLSISHGIVRSHSGTLTATSEEGRGTTFTIELPKAG